MKSTPRKKLINKFVDSEPNFEVSVNFESKNQDLTRHITSTTSRVLKVIETAIVVEDYISLSIQPYNAFNAVHLIKMSESADGVSGFSPLIQ
jgi:hypothetical protein